LINNAVPNQRQEQEEVHTTTIHTEDEGNSNNSHEEKWMKKAKIEQLNQRQILFFVPEHISMIEPWLQRKEEFMSMHFPGIVSCEDTSFVAFPGGGGGTPERFESRSFT
jgi:hypothetical protein